MTNIGTSACLFGYWFQLALIYISLRVTSRETVWHLYLLYGFGGGVCLLLLGCYIDVMLLFCWLLIVDCWLLIVDCWLLIVVLLIVDCCFVDCRLCFSFIPFCFFSEFRRVLLLKDVMRQDSFLRRTWWIFSNKSDEQLSMSWRIKKGSRATQLTAQDIKQFHLVIVYAERRNVHKQSPHKKEKEQLTIMHKLGTNIQLTRNTLIE